MKRQNKEDKQRVGNKDRIRRIWGHNSRHRNHYTDFLPSSSFPVSDTAWSSRASKFFLSDSFFFFIVSAIQLKRILCFWTSCIHRSYFSFANYISDKLSLKFVRSWIKILQRFLRVLQILISSFYAIYAKNWIPRRTNGESQDPTEKSSRFLQGLEQIPGTVLDIRREDPQEI